MKKIFFFAASCLAFAACSNESLVDDYFGGQAKDGPITFKMTQKNMTRSYTDMQETGHYNFGVFAFKSTDKDIAVMPNYLVGYYDNNNAYQETGSTVGDKEGQVDGQSYWMYEGMGASEYAGTYAGGALTDAFKSNNANQYLKFWDNAADKYCFYAYAPYLNADANGGKTATYVDGVAKDPSTDKYVLTIPNGLLKAGYDDPSLAEYMYASKKVERGSYGLDVPLHFTRLNAKVNIKFWEDVPGYKVRILDLQDGTYEGVQAAASIKKASDGTTPATNYTPYGYRAGKFYLENGIKVKFNADAAEQAKYQFQGKLAEPVAYNKSGEVLLFKSPTAAEIGETRFTAAASPTDYYAIPKNATQVVKNSSVSMDATDIVAADEDLAKTGFTFHVSYELTAEDTGERIRVNNATVHVPADFCDWKSNTHYTYIFKITKNSNGTTLDPTDPSNPQIDPTDPDVPEVQALYPIVFDNCTVQDWDEIEGEWNISDGDNLAYHDVKLSTYSLASGDIDVTVTDNDKFDGHHIDYSKITVTGPAADVTTWYNDGTHKITVPTGATQGVYTVTYECTGAPESTTHPAKWSETFFVGDSYSVATHVTEIGTNAAAVAYLDITAKKGTTETTADASAAGQLSIVYPDNFTAAQKGKVKVNGTQVEVATDATPGAYKLVYKINEGKEVKVAEQIFNVVDYNFTLSTYKVFLNGTTQNVVANVQAPASPVTGEVTATGFTVTGNSVAVPNTTAEGTYTVTYTVGTGNEQTVYTNQFTVANTHAVKVSKGALKSQLNWDNISAFADDYLWITTTFNGVDATAAEADVLTIEDAAGTDVTANFSIAWDDTEKKYKLQAKTNVALGTYYVVYTKAIESVATKQKAQVIVTK